MVRLRLSKMKFTLKYLKSLSRSSLASFGLGVTSKRHLEFLENSNRQSEKVLWNLTYLKDDLQRLIIYLKSELLDTKSTVAAIELLNESESQLRQDLFVLIVSGWKRKGYFVEFGATDGKHFSNTWILEKKYGWDGILAEPDPRFHKNLASNRATNIEFSCVYTRTGDTINFLQAGQL
jgi:hypothetical protein